MMAPLFLKNGAFIVTMIKPEKSYQSDHGYDDGSTFFEKMEPSS